MWLETRATLRPDFGATFCLIEREVIALSAFWRVGKSGITLDPKNTERWGSITGSLITLGEGIEQSSLPPFYYS